MTLLSRQHPDGHWEGEVVWNTMLLSQYLITHRLLESEVDVAAARRHYAHTMLPDGSWPFHVEAEEGSLYVTALAYVAQRLTGTPAAELARTRAWLRAAGVENIPTWGKVWLALVGLYPWEAVNPLVPEVALTPVVRRLYCHTRYVYLGMAYLYGVRFTSPVADELRDELLGGEVDFAAHRHAVHESDLLDRPSRLLRFVFDVLHRYERRPLKWLRAKAARRCADLIDEELTQSRGHGISPVSALLGCLVLAHAGRARDGMLATLDVWNWQDDEIGLRVAGARSASWDTAFAMRALLAGAPPEAELKAAHRWLLDRQATEELPSGQTKFGRMRSPIIGGFCFTEGTHRWPVSDCAAEALSALLIADETIGTTTPAHRAAQAAEFMMARQNRDGGFGTYERARLPRWVEKLNPAEMFTGCMTDLSQVEVTASCVSALVRYRDRWPDPRADKAIRRGVEFLRARQRPDGAYLGSWGINFTYAAFFVVEALMLAGVPVDDPAIAGVATWLVAHQREDGGWGEHYRSCHTGEYLPHVRGQATMTAWALLALAPALGPDHPAVLRGARFLNACDPAEDAASGVYFGSGVLDYRMYREVFPQWAANVVKGYVVWA